MSAPRSGAVIDSDSDDEEVPLAVLRKRQLEAKKATAAGAKPVAAAPPAEKKPKVKKETALSRSKAAGSATPAALPERKPPKKSTGVKRERSGASKTRTPKSGPSASKDASSAKKRRPDVEFSRNGGRKLSKSDDVTIKEQAVEAVLVRWWHCGLQWPPAELESWNVPPTFRKLGGMPGVAVGVEGDDIGKVLDARKPEWLRPSQNDLMELPCEVIGRMWLKGLHTQHDELVKAEGPNCDAIAGLRDEVKYAVYIIKNAAKADKQAKEHGFEVKRQAPEYLERLLPVLGAGNNGSLPPAGAAAGGAGQ